MRIRNIVDYRVRTNRSSLNGRRVNCNAARRNAVIGINSCSTKLIYRVRLRIGTPFNIERVGAHQCNDKYVNNDRSCNRSGRVTMRVIDAVCDSIRSSSCQVNVGNKGHTTRNIAVVIIESSGTSVDIGCC